MLSAESVEAELSHLNIEDANFSFDEIIGTDSDTKIITMQEYTNLVNLIPQVEKFKKIVGQLKEEIQKKDDEILELKKRHLFDLTEQKLLDVSIDKNYKKLTDAKIF